MKSTIAILRRVRELIERGWCQHAYAMNFKSDAVSIHDQYLTRVCLIGAFGVVANETGQDVLSAMHALAKWCRGNLGKWNDLPGRSKAEVLTTLDDAINYETRK